MKNRSFGLDVWRAIAIWFVMFGHVAYWFDLGGNEFFVKYIAPLNLGVEPFFVLGGFLATISFKDIILLKNVKMEFSDVSHYLKRRWARTVPNYILFLGVFTFSFYLFKPEFSFDVNYLFFTQNLYWLAPNFFSVSWSLATQEWFYLLLPLLIYIVHKFIPNKTLPVAALGLVVISLTFKLLYINSNEILNLEGEIRRIALFRLDSIAMGVFVGWLYIIKKGFFEQNQKILIVSIGVVFLLSFLRQKDWFNTLWFVQLMYYPLFSFFLALIIPYFFKIKCRDDFLLRKLIINTSKWSYSIYLCHVWFLDAIFTIASKIGLPILHSNNAYYLTLLWVGLVYLCSSVLYSKFEMPTMKFLLKKFK